MELLKGAQTVVNFASYYPLLHKATADNDTPCPGYVYEEVIKLSRISSGHREHLVHFLLARMNASSCAGKHKVVNVLRHLTHRGPVSIRVLLRSRDGQLRSLCGVSAGGGPTLSGGGGGTSPQDFTGRSPQLMLHGAVQELLSDLFDPQLMHDDEEKTMLGEKHTTAAPPKLSAMGVSGVSTSLSSSSSKSKYQGFGFSPRGSSPTVINKVRGLMDRILWPDVKELSTTAQAILNPSPGNYVPFEIPTEYLKELAPLIHGGGVDFSVGVGGRSYDGGIRGSYYEGSSGRASIGYIAMEDKSFGTSKFDARSSMSSMSRSLAFGGQEDSSLGMIGSTILSARSSTGSTGGRTHRTGRAGGGWDDEGDSDADQDESQDFHSFIMKPLGENSVELASKIQINVDTQNLRLEKSLTNMSSSLTDEQKVVSLKGNKESEFVNDFIKDVMNPPMSVSIMFNKCRMCAELDPHLLLSNISKLLHPKSDSDSLKLDTISSISIETSSQTSTPKQPLDGSPTNIFTLSVDEQLMLLTLIDYCVHDGILHPIVVEEELVPTFRALQEEGTVNDVVRFRTIRISKDVESLVSLLTKG